MKLMKKIAAGMVLTLAGSSAFAAGAIDQLNSYIAKLDTLKASFTQTIYDADSQPLQTSKGNVVLKRPGRFRWDYTDPAPQLIVADGKKLWIYDKELEQVTVKKMDQVLGQAPIMLLTSKKPLTEEFALRELGDRQGMSWVELKPKASDTDFHTIYLGLDKQGLKTMEMRDSFGQATQIKFSEIQKNKGVNESQFQFTAPKNVDVIGE